MKITQRLALVLAVPLLVLGGLGIFFHLQTAKIAGYGRDVAEIQIPTLALIGHVTRAYGELRVDARDYILAETETARARTHAHFLATEAEMNRLLDRYLSTLLLDEEDRRLLNAYRTLTGQWTAGAKLAMATAVGGQQGAAMGQLVGSLHDVAEQVNGAAALWIRHNERLADRAGQLVVRTADAVSTRSWIATGTAVLVTAILGFITFRRIVRPIESLEAAVKAIAAGDYQLDVPYTQAVDETGSLARSVDLLKREAAQTQALLAQTKKQEQELQRVNFLSDSALDLTSAGYWHVPLDNSGWYNSSPRAVRIYGDPPTGDWRYRLDHWAKQVEAADPALAKDAFESFGKAVAGEVPVYEAVYRYLRPVDNRIVWIHAAGRVVRDAAGKPTDLFGVAQDITASKIAELALKESEQSIRETEQFFRGVLELAPDGMMVVNADGTLHLANAQCERLFGYSREELVGQKVEMLVPSEVRGQHPDLRASFHRAPVARSMGAMRELYAQRKDGSRFPVEVGLSPLSARQGSLQQVAVSVRDITERRQAEADLKAAKQKAEEATQLKSMFLANMSHEIRTPMNAIIGLSYLALKTPLNAKQRDYVTKVHNAGTALLGVINDILDFSKIEAGRLDIETTSFRLDDVISSVTTVTAQKAHEKGLEFLAQVGPGIAEYLRGDPVRLGQVLTNLVNNSVKFTERGEIHLSVELVEQNGERCALKFSVRDTGIGMTPAQLDRLFQPFVQADMSTTRKHGGTGLGLTICRRLVELMGGQISVETEPGCGSTFTFTVWLGRDNQLATRRVIPEKLTKLRALIVDDNDAARQIMDDLVDGVVYHADVVGSGREAISAVRQHDTNSPYDVVFMDWRMPGMDGFEAARSIKTDTSLKNPPAVIMVTAFGREEVRDEAERLGLEGFLVKPVTKSMVVDTLINVFVDAGENVAAVLEAKNEGVRLDGLRVFLVEDNEINQQIAIELIEGVGAKVTVANNGREALDRLISCPEDLPFDVVLMDLQMPEMDGHEATRRLRAEKRFAALPIIAMTAHATMEEREACVASGMNGHLSKPIEPAVLFDTLSKLCSSGSSTSKAPPPSVEASSLPAINGMDTVGGLARVGGNQKLYLKLLGQFVEKQSTGVAQISEALKKGDLAAAERLAHSMKGVAGNLGAQRVQELAGKVENLLREGRPVESVHAAVAEVGAALDPLLARLREVLRGTSEDAPPAQPALPVDPARIRDAAEQLIKLLGVFDAAAVEFMETNATTLRLLFHDEAWLGFQKKVNSFSFGEAQSLLQEAIIRQS